MGEFLSFSCDDSCWREQRETGEWEGWTKCEQFIGLGRLKGFVNYPGLICHHMMFAMG